MSELNPYASPQSPFSSVPPPISQAQGGLWREGNLLVMHKDAPLPDRCVKCNQPANGLRLKRNLQWHHPAIMIAIISPVIYIVLALIFMKRATIHIGLSAECLARRRRAILISTLVVLAGIACFVGGIALADREPNFVLLIWGGVALFFGGLIYGLIAARLVRPAKITDTHVWLKGVHPDFLAGLPELPS